MSGNDSMGEEKPRGLRSKLLRWFLQFCRLGLSGKEERDLGQKLTLGKHKSDGQEDQEKKGPTKEVTSSWLQFYFV